MADPLGDTEDTLFSVAPRVAVLQLVAIGVQNLLLINYRNISGMQCCETVCLYRVRVG